MTSEFFDTALTATIGGALGWIARDGWSHMRMKRLQRHFEKGTAYAHECYRHGRTPDQTKVCCKVFADGMGYGISEIMQDNPDMDKLEAMGVEVQVARAVAE